MCGISGIWGKNSIAEVSGMMDLMTHRGPDARGMFISPDDNGTLGHTRLSIMDPEGGDQPIYSEDNSMAIIANGEIYNFPVLHSELSQRHTFPTTSDSEAILHLYEEHGPRRRQQPGQ